MADDAADTTSGMWEKQRDRSIAEKEQWSHSGLTQHHQHCDGPIDDPTILSSAKRAKTKDALNFNLKVEESLWIRRRNCGPGKGMNEDWGTYVKTQAWTPVFNKMD